MILGEGGGWTDADMEPADFVALSLNTKVIGSVSYEQMDRLDEVPEFGESGLPGEAGDMCVGFGGDDESCESGFR